MIGRLISHYKILEKLGEGGMGVVYTAQDTKLNRIVALKFLPHNVKGSEAEQARFLQEARAAAALNHPNICTIHGIEEYEGQQFIDMEYVDGKTLRQREEGGGLKLDDAIQFAIQVGDALSEAHGKGVVHRDIKADNIMVNSRNQIKVMDFGLAKLKGSVKLTRTSSTIGTLAYMAPEQIQGEVADSRSDIFSFGVVFFEMLTGRLPFRGEHEAAIMYSIVNEEPTPIATLRPDCTPEIGHIIGKALEKDPADRYQSVSEMVVDLRRTQKQSARVSRTALVDIQPQGSITRQEAAPVAGGLSGVSPNPAKRTMTRTVVLVAGIIAVVAAAIWFYLNFFHQTRSLNSLAVLPFANASADQNTEYLADGITESIINSLTRIKELRVTPRSTVFRFKGKDVDPDEIGKKLGVGAILTGRLTQRGDILDIQLDLIDIESQAQIWGEHFRKNVNEVLSLQDDIVTAVTKNLGLTVSNEIRQDVTKRYTENAEAYKLYLQGRFYWNKRSGPDLERAIDFFNRAIILDPQYALAYAGLADSYLLQEQYAGIPANVANPRAEVAIVRALELDSTLAEAHSSLAFVHEYNWRWEDAEREFKQSIRLNPKYATAYHWYSIMLRTLGRYDEATVAITKAYELDPLSLVILTNMGLDAYGRRDFDEAILRCQKAIELDASFAPAYIWMGKAYLGKGMTKEALTHLKRAVDLSNHGTEALSNLGYAYGRGRFVDEARSVLDELLAKYKSGGGSAFNVARVYAGLGDNARALDWLEIDYRDHTGWLRSLPTDDEWDALRSDPRFVGLLKKMGMRK
jgi:serine/threonine-protein kinase